MGLDQEFIIWYSREASAATRAWAEQFAGSNDPRTIYRELSSAKLLANDRECTKAFRLDDISILRFFPQIMGFCHRPADRDGPWKRDPIRGGFATLTHLPAIRELWVSLTQTNQDFDIKNLRHIQELRISGAKSGDFQFLEGWEGLQNLEVDILPNNFLPPPQ